MKERTSCIMDEHNCSSEQLEDALMQCGDFLDLVALTQDLQDGRLDIYDMAERLTNLLGRGEPLVSMATSEDDEEDVSNDAEDIEEANGRCGDEEWISGDDNSGDRDHHLLLAGYSDCMTEALRYLVEEERYSPEHPVVEGLRTHLAQQQDRVLLEAARAHHHHHHRHVMHLDNSRPANNNSSNNNNNSNQVVDVRNRVALVSDTVCNIRPPAI